MQRKTTMDHFVDCITEGKQISALFCARRPDRLLCYWLAACLWPGSCPRFSREFDFFLLGRFPAKTRGWVLFLDPCNLSTGEVQWTTGLILWLYGNAQEGRQKTNKVSAPKLRASAGETRSLIPWSLEIAEALLDKSNTFENTIFHDWMQPAVQRPLEPTRISYSRTKIPATLCLPLDPEGMFWRLKPKHHLFHVNLMSAALLRIGHIEIKIWENLVCHLVFSFFPLIDFN